MIRREDENENEEAERLARRAYEAYYATREMHNIFFVRIPWNMLHPDARNDWMTIAKTVLAAEEAEAEVPDPAQVQAQDLAPAENDGTCLQEKGTQTQ